MKISLLHYSGLPVIGGVEKVMARQAQLFLDNGHEVVMILGRGECFNPSIPVSVIPEIDSKNSRVLALKDSLDKGEVPADFQDFKNTLKAKLLPSIASSDVVLLHNVCTLHKNLALTAALLELAEEHREQKFVAWTHDLAWTSSSYAEELYDAYPWKLLSSANPYIKYVVISEHRRRELCALTGIEEDKVVIIPNGIDADCIIRPESGLRILLDKTNFLIRGPRLVIPMRITRRKNIEMALRMMRYLIETMPDACLLITGPQGAHNQLNSVYFEELCKLRLELNLKTAVHFAAEICPPLGDYEVYDLIKLADVVFLPSLEEGFGLPLLESALLGTLVCCTNIAPFREIGKKEVVYVDPLSSPEEIAAQVQEMLINSTRLAFRRRVLREYSWQNLYEQAILPLIEGSGACGL